MKIPPLFGNLLQKAAAENRLPSIIDLSQQLMDNDYRHWDKVRHLQPPTGFTSEEWWAAIKFQRAGSMKPLPLLDKAQQPFHFSVPDVVQKALHQIDVGAGRSRNMAKATTLFTKLLAVTS